MTGPLILFAVLAAISVVAGIAMIVQENPVRSALCLVTVLFSVALLFLSLYASFIAAVQIIVYAGAIMVLFIFVIMLLNLGAPDGVVDHLKAQKYVSPFIGIALVILLAAVICAVPSKPVMLTSQVIGPYEIGIELFKANWLFPFEVVSILLLVAAIGAVMLAKKRI